MTACQRARERLSEDERDDQVEAHLVACADCRAWAEALDAVRHHAPGLVAGPPPALVAEAHRALGLSARAAGTAAPASGWRRWTRRTPTGIAAAVIVGVVGIVAVVMGPGAPDAADVGAAATLERVAETHAGRGTSYAFDLEGSVELRLPDGEVTPGRRHLVAELARLADDPGAEPAADAARQVDVTYRARGEADGRGTLRYELRWQVTAPQPHAGVLEVATVDGTHWLRPNGATRWVRVGDTAGFDLGSVVVPHHLAEVLADLGDVREAGVVERTRLDGEPVEQVRARTATGMVVDAWVGADDGWLRRLRWIPAPPDTAGDGTTHGELTARLREHGTPREVDAPEDGRPLDEVEPRARPPFVALDQLG